MVLPALEMGRYTTENQIHDCISISGLCAIDLTAPYELLLWSLIDSQMYADTISLLHAYEVSSRFLFLSLFDLASQESVMCRANSPRRFS